MSFASLVPASAVSATVCRNDGGVHYHRKATIAVNNAAVGLLVSKSYQGAIETLNDAIKLMKCVEDYKHGNESLETVSLSLERAWGRIAVCGGRRDSCSPSPSSLLETGHTQITFQAISSEYDPASIYDALTAGAKSSHTKFPMTIDPSEYQECSVEWSNDFHTSVLLYNYGIACNCVAATATTASVKELFQQRAYQFFQLANSLLYKQFQHRDRNKSSTFFANDRLLQLKVFVTYNLIEACVLLSLDCQEHTKNLDNVLLQIEARERAFPTETPNIAPAA